MSNGTRGKKFHDVKEELEGLNVYIEGKMKRYNLLFAVNGGAFAVAKLLGDGQTKKLLGGLGVRELAVGTAVFTVLMAFDIWKWGHMMREDFFGGEQVFGAPGKFVVVAIGSLLAGGWLLAAFGESMFVYWIIVAVIGALIVGLFFWQTKNGSEKASENSRSNNTSDV